MNIPASISVGICWDGFEVLLIITNTVTSHSERVTWRACSSNENGFLRAKAWIWNNSIRQLQFVLAWLLKVILGYVFHWKDLPVICFQMYSWRISYIIQWHRIIFYLPFPTHLQLSPDIPWHGSWPVLTYFLFLLFFLFHYLLFFIKPSEILARMGKHPSGPYSEELLEVDCCCGGVYYYFGVWPLVSFTGSSDWPHIHAHMGITNWT